jgi:hypothetical protein
MRYLAFRHGLLAGIFAAALSLTASAIASTPPLVWQGARAVRVQCVVQTEAGSGVSPFQAALCERVARIAARGAPVPVSTIALGDPQILGPGTVALLVHASVQPGPGATRLLAFTLRPFRASAEQTAVLFGAAPRAVALPQNGAASPALEAALAAALSETLPWQQRPQGPRAMPRRPNQRPNKN